MSLADYLQAVGLPQYVWDIETTPVTSSLQPPPRPFNELFNESNGVAASLTDKEVAELYTYKVPRDDTALSPRGVLLNEPFNLATEVFHIPYDFEELRTTHKDTTEWLWRLHKLVKLLQQQTGIQWLGIYRTVALQDYDGLVKLAYFGEYSRPIMPLTPEFADVSNDAWVGRNGKARLISDLTNHKGTYYRGLSDNEKSELCIPIFGQEGEVVGIINAESWEVGECALPKVVIPIAQACVDLANTSFATVPS